MEMNMMHIPVCKVPEGNGFRIEYLPESLEYDGIDNCAPHLHSFYEILWFKEGDGVHTVDFRQYVVKPNTLFFLSPGMIHHFDNPSRYKGLTIKMCADFMKNESNMFLKYNVFNSFDTLPYYNIDDDTARELDRLVKTMLEEAPRHQEFGNTVILESLLRIFLVKIHRHGHQDDTQPLDTLKPSHQLFISFRRLVEKEYKNLHTVQDYAERLNVAVRTLNKSVNECSRISPLTFINDRIILEAKRMVRYSDMMIKEIAFELGYEDPSYFVKFFRRQTGYLPSDFRELDNVVS